MSYESPNGTLKFLCSYGGKILPRQIDGKLRYIGGLTRVLAVGRSISFSELMAKLEEFCGSSIALKCQLPGGDLETLISVRSDEDFANIVEEYDRASSSLSHPLKIRAVLSTSKSLPNSACNDVDSLPSSPQYGINERISSPSSYRFIRKISSPPSKYFVGSRNCHGRSCCSGSPRFLYSVLHSAHWN